MVAAGGFLVSYYVLAAGCVVAALENDENASSWIARRISIHTEFRNDKSKLSTRLHRLNQLSSISKRQVIKLCSFCSSIPFLVICISKTVLVSSCRTLYTQVTPLREKYSRMHFYTEVWSFNPFDI